MTCNEALMKMKETLASIPPMKRLNTAPFLSYQRFMTVTQGSSVHQAVSPACSRKVGLQLAGQLMLDTTLASKSVLAFAVMGLTSTNSEWTVRNSTYNHKKKTYALVKAHKRTEVYATVLGTDRQNVAHNSIQRLRSESCHQSVSDVINLSI